MDHPLQQSTLRQLQAFLLSTRFWSTFGVIVLLFAVVGPYGTIDTMSFGPRFCYWLLVQAIAWGIAISFSVVSEVLLRNVVPSVFARMMAGSLFAALPIGVGLDLMGSTLAGNPMTLASGLGHALAAAPLCALFCVLTYMTMNSAATTATDEPLAIATQNISETAAPILKRLKPEKRGPLLRLSVRDHYTEVFTTRGSELVLLRFADAVRETAGISGAQVHRSHWIADANVKALKRDNGRIAIVTTDDMEIPVSRTYTSSVRRRFG